MLGWILLAVGIAGFGYAGWKDLKTTEFEDWLPYSIIIAALVVRGAYALFSGDFTVITGSVLYGLIFLGFGYLLYFLKQWGDGDAWLMGAMGFLFPDAAGFAPLYADFMPFPITFVFNFFIVALIYLVVYAIVLGIRTPKVYKAFVKNLRERKIAIGAIFVFLLASATASSLYVSSNYLVPVTRFSTLFVLPFLAVAILVFLQYARAVERDLFKRKVKAKDVRVGDVIISDKWRGLTEEDVKKLHKKGGDVWIKEGVRFAPVFVISLLVTVFVGNLMSILIPV